MITLKTLQMAPVHYAKFHMNFHVLCPLYFQSPAIHEHQVKSESEQPDSAFIKSTGGAHYPKDDGRTQCSG